MVIRGRHLRKEQLAVGLDEVQGALAVADHEAAGAAAPRRAFLSGVSGVGQQAGGCSPCSAAYRRDSQVHYLASRALWGYQNRRAGV